MNCSKMVVSVRAHTLNTIPAPFPPIARRTVQLYFTETVFSVNHATGAGGAVSAESGARIESSGCVFDGNNAGGGGAVYATGADTQVEVSLCSLRRNNATKEGGALRVNGDSYLSAHGYVLAWVRTQAGMSHGWLVGWLGSLRKDPFRSTFSVNEVAE